MKKQCCKNKKLKLTWIPYKCSRIDYPHYDLHTDEKIPKNIACILVQPNHGYILRKMLKAYTEL